MLLIIDIIVIDSEVYWIFYFYFFALHHYVEFLLMRSFISITTFSEMTGLITERFSVGAQSTSLKSEVLLVWPEKMYNHII